MVRNADYGWERHYRAILGLMEGSGSPNERLAHALFELAILRSDRLHGVPDHLWVDFETFMDEMTSVPATGDEGTIQATVATLELDQVKLAMEKILSFYTRIVEYKAKL